MKIRNKKVLALMATAAVVVPSAVLATTTTVDVTATFANALTLTSADMAFGNIDTGGLSIPASLVTMDTTGAITYGAGFAGSGAGTAGLVTVTAATDGEVVEIRCDTGALLAEAGAATIALINVEVQAEGGAAAPCNGIGGAAATTMTLDILGTTADTFTFGGALDGSTASAPATLGLYDTGLAGGDPIDVDVIYQ